MKIVDYRVTPIAFSDPPLRAAMGLHAPYAYLGLRYCTRQRCGRILGGGWWPRLRKGLRQVGQRSGKSIRQLGRGEGGRAFRC